MQYALDTALKLEVTVYSAFDNDLGGNEGHERLLKLNKKNKIVRHEPIKAKDWNDYLITMYEPKDIFYTLNNLQPFGNHHD